MCYSYPWLAFDKISIRFITLCCQNIPFIPLVMQNISSQELKILLVGIVLKDLLTYSSVVARDQSFCLDNTKLPVHPYTTALPFFCFGCWYIALPSTQCSEGSLWSSRWFRAVYNITRLIHGCMRFSAKVRDLAIISC